MLLVTVRSNVELTREVLSRQSRIRTAVVGVPLPGCSDELLTLITNLLALSPGTMPIELRHDPIVLYVHVLHLTDIEEVRRQIVHLADLTVRAFGTADAVADQAAYMRAREAP
jgi:multicomponent Na+:H+ antiporter subunit E